MDKVGLFGNIWRKSEDLEKKKSEYLGAVGNKSQVWEKEVHTFYRTKRNYCLNKIIYH